MEANPEHGTIFRFQRAGGGRQRGDRRGAPFSLCLTWINARGRTDNDCLITPQSEGLP
jgi:hypothetical protein